MSGISDFMTALGAWGKENAGAIGATFDVGSAVSSMVGGVFGQRQGRINAKFLEEQGRQAYASRVSQELQAAGTARAAAAKGGADPNMGSASDVSRQIEAEGRVAALREKFAFQNEAAFVQRRGQNALFGGILGGASTLLGAANRFDVVDDNDDLVVPGGTGEWEGVPYSADDYWSF